MNDALINLQAFREGIVADRRADPRGRADDLRIWLIVDQRAPATAFEIADVAARSAGACMQGAERSSPDLVDAYVAGGQPKITVRAESADDVRKLAENCRAAGQRAALAESGSLICVAVGPCSRGDLPGKVRRLRVYDAPWAPPTAGAASRSGEGSLEVIARSDLVISPGKFAAQAAHAYASCLVLAGRSGIPPRTGFELPQVRLRWAPGEAALRTEVEIARGRGEIAVLVEDAGRTEFDGPTLTAAAIAPSR